MKKLLLALLIISTQSWAMMNSNPQTHYTLSFEQELGLIAEVQFAEELNDRHDNRFALTFTDVETQLTVNPKLYVNPYLWMVMPNGHEHGSAPIQLEKIDPVSNMFFFYNVFFVMPGKWQFRLRLEDQDCKFVDTNYDADKSVCYIEKQVEFMVPGQMNHGGHGGHGHH